MAVYLPEVDLALWLPRIDETQHIPSDRWLATCNATVNGQSFFQSRFSGSNPDSPTQFGMCFTAADSDAGPPVFMTLF